MARPLMDHGLPVDLRLVRAQHLFTNIPAPSLTCFFERAARCSQGETWKPSSR
jgi:hypothetical protein